MQTGYQVLYPEGKVLHGAVYWPVRPDSDLVEALVRPYLDNAQIEHLPVMLDGSRRCMFVADLSHLRLGDPTVPPHNAAATAIYHESRGALSPGVVYWRAVIAGTAVLFERDIWA
jgi:hypothetical protein